MYYLVIYFLTDAMGTCNHHKCLGLTVSVYSHVKTILNWQVSWQIYIRLSTRGTQGV